jgi:hypothetical protein
MLATNVTAWRCGGILCSFCRQLKPIKDIKFNSFYCCLIYNIKLELPMNSELLLIAPTSRRHNAKPIVSGSCLSGRLCLATFKSQGSFFTLSVF